MDDQRFDEWARRVGGGVARRRVLRTLAGGALGGVLLRLGVARTAAACIKYGKRCERGDTCCTGAVCKGDRCRCLNQGAVCASSHDCCPEFGTCARISRRGGKGGPGGCGSSRAKRCCKDASAAGCTGDCDCCGDLVCQASGAQFICCALVGSRCLGDNDCCGTLTCVRDPANPRRHTCR